MSFRACGFLVLLLAVSAFPQEKQTTPEKKKECGPVRKPVTVYFCQKPAPEQEQVVDKVKLTASPLAPTACSEQDACPKGKACKINHVILPAAPIPCNFGPAPPDCPKGVKQAWACTATVTFDCHCK